MKYPKLPITLGLALSGAAMTAQGAQIAYDDFPQSVYPRAEQIQDSDGGGAGWDGPWEYVARNDTWNSFQPVADAAPFGELLTNGQGVGGFGGRVMRPLETPVSSGVVWASVVLAPLNSNPAPADLGSNQFYLYSDKSDVTDLKPYGDPFADLIVGGVRYHSGGELEIVDVSKGTIEPDGEDDDDLPDRIGFEQFIPLNAEVTGTDEDDNPIYEVDPVTSAVFAVIKIDMTAGTASYYFFMPDDMLGDPSDASYMMEDVEISDERDVEQVGYVAMASWSAGQTPYNNVRVGDTFFDVAPVTNCEFDAPEARSPVTADGDDSEDVWSAAEAYVVGNIYDEADDDRKSPDSADDYAGSLKAAWDADNFYVLVSVTDDDFVDSGSAQDAVELFFDFNNSRNYTESENWPPAGYDGVDDMQLIVSADGSISTGGAPSGLDTSAITTGVSSTATGWMIEVSIPWSFVPTGMPSGSFGMDVSAVDNDAADTMKSQAFLCDTENRVWTSPYSMGTMHLAVNPSPLISYDFSDLTDGEEVSGEGDDSGPFDGAWYDIWAPAWASSGPAIAGPALDFPGDYATGGMSLQTVEGGAGRIGRTLDTTFSEGAVWAAWIVGPGQNGSSQFWLGDATLLSENDASGVVAGTRSNNGMLQVIDIYSDRQNQENYINTGIFPAAPTLVITKIDLDFDTVEYWIFEGGTELDPENASAYFDLAEIPDAAFEPLDTPDVSGIAFSAFGAGAGVGNLAFGQTLSQVMVDADIMPNCSAQAAMAAEAPEIDGDMDDWWEAAATFQTRYNLLNDDSKREPASDADLSATVYALHDADNLYLMFDVLDDDVVTAADHSSGDRVELFLDFDYSRTVGNGWQSEWPNRSYDLEDDMQVVFALSDSSVTIYGEAANPNGYRSANAGPGVDDAELDNWSASYSTNSTGYILEIAIPLSEFDMGNMIGFDVAVNDEDTGMDARVQQFWCDQNNKVWESPADMGTLWMAGERPQVAWFGNGAAVGQPIANASETVSEEGASSSFDVNTNLSYVAYEVSAEAPWITLDESPTMGAATAEFTVAANEYVFSRTGSLTLGGDSLILNSADIMQGPGDDLASPSLLQMLGGRNPRIAGNFAADDEEGMGYFTYDNYPWINFAETLGWSYGYESATDWLFTWELADFVYTPEYPWVYAYGWEDASSGWYYIATMEDMSTGEMVAMAYDWGAGTWMELFRFTEESAE